MFHSDVDLEIKVFILRTKYVLGLKVKAKVWVLVLMKKSENFKAIVNYICNIFVVDIKPK